MPAMETKESEGKLLPHSDLRGVGGLFLGDKIEKNEMGWACGAYG